MNKQQLYTAGSVLLATTALTSAANAGAVSGVITAGTVIGTQAYTALNIANTVFSTTAATANAVTVGPTSIYIAFANNFTAATKFSVELDPINAGFVQTVDSYVLLSSAGSFLTGFTVAASTACTSVT